ncbi:MAG: hypothetical protein EON87_04415 [Brevundimonas sp.]|nr:MAG: hypothetical protein EON87_04415 [Brevundimonas sp.]
MGGQSHTAERWRVDPNSNCDIQSEDGTREIASTHPDVLDGGFCDPSTAQAYARLIAAAPEMLAALIALRSSHETAADRFQAGYDADAAIAKAAGEGAQ